MLLLLNFWSQGSLKPLPSNACKQGREKLSWLHKSQDQTRILTVHSSHTRHACLTDVGEKGGKDNLTEDTPSKGQEGFRSTLPGMLATQEFFALPASPRRKFRCVFVCGAAKGLCTQNFAFSKSQFQILFFVLLNVQSCGP